MEEFLKLGRPAAFLVSSASGLDTLLAESKRLSSRKRFILLLRDDARLTVRLLPALLDAGMRSAENCMKSGSMQMEILLMLSGTTNIGKAIRDNGAIGSTRFMVFASDSRTVAEFLRRTASRIEMRHHLSFDTKAAAELAAASISE